MSDALHIKYRPRKLSEVIGQDAICTALGKLIERHGSQAFLFSGPSGCGKTTIARIAARMLECKSKDILEIDAATYTGIESMRQIQEILRYKPFGNSEHRAVIIDECHSLSKQSWQSLLKSIEEPPEHVSWFFCTTEPGKVPDTIKTRCSAFTLASVSDDQLTDLIIEVAKEEGIKLQDTVRGLIVKEAGGSPRQALVNLSLCRDVADRATAAQLLRSILNSDATRAFCQFLISGGSWLKAMALVEQLGETNPESVRIMVCNYLGAALKKAKTEKETCHFLRILENFSIPFNASEGAAPLLLAVGRCLYANG
jgi:DNA polymerase-3 subunit gamma/tau